MSYLDDYRNVHTHPMNRALHTIGIPLIVLSLPLVFVSWRWALGAFVGGWILQFVGHAFEGKAPAFFSHPRYLLVGVQWWWKKRG